VLRKLLAVTVLVTFSALMWPASAHLTHAQTPDDHTTPSELRTDQGHKIAGKLMCQCGCGLTVAACRDSMTCSMASGLVDQIERQVAAGKTDPEIKDYFVSVYGEQILAMPSKNGFNLTAWALPFLAVGAGGVVLLGFTLLWVRRRSAAAQEAAPAAENATLSQYEERVDQDMLLME
jgi:cytochrome c-type biogenesis protein CcmH